jgi:uncharacterized protein
MKINQDWQMSLNNRDKQAVKTKEGSNFGQVFSKNQQKLHIEQLNKLISEIEVAGQRLNKSRTFKDLVSYKNMVKNFVHEAVEFGLEIKQSFNWGTNGDSRTLKIIEKIDKDLLEVTKKLIDTEKNAIDILGKIGEIKGLLVDLYK